ncbi:MAG: hypothetical protein KatS3mg115_1986 [Candidatus Poribacteria bacterium]|nr:MAG: hypothetical protein KatS3mg115_1986 [Candidatus Poribacteria bacterium]
MSEGSSVAGRIGEGLYHYTLPYPSAENVQDTADRLCRFVISLLANGVQKVFLYSMHSHFHFPGENAWRVLVTSDGMPHPSAAAFAVTAYLLEGTQPKAPFEIQPGLHGYPFVGSGRTVLVLAPRSESRFIPPSSLEWSLFDLWGNPYPEGQPLGKTIAYLVSERLSVEELRERLTRLTPPGEGAETGE